MSFRRRLPLFLPVLTLSGLGLLACGDDSTPKPRGPVRHVIFLSLDTTRADHLGAYGDTVKTPQLDRIARDGVVLEELSTVATTTLASHASVFSGTYPFTHGVPRNGFLLHDDNVLLAEILKEQGYRTAAILGSYALEPLFGIDQGFDYVNQDFSVALGQGTVFDQAQRDASLVTQSALDFLSTVEDEPTFMFLHYFDAHQPYTPPAPFDRMYWDAPPPFDLETFPEAGSRRFHQRKSGAEPRSIAHLIVEGLDREHLVDPHIEPIDTDFYLASQYAGEISYMDQEIGRLFDELERRGMWDDTLIVVFGDHGETFWEHGDQWNHGLGAYQTTVHVPGLVKLPKQEAAGTRLAGAVSSVDLLPTTLEALGLPIPEPVEGRSLLSFFRGAPFQDAPVFGEATQPRRTSLEAGGWYNRNKPNFVRMGDLKLIVSPYVDLEEVYDLEADPGERVNLLESLAPEEKARLEDELAAWRERANPLPSEFIPESNPDAMQGLRRLGYIGK